MFRGLKGKLLAIVVAIAAICAFVIEHCGDDGDKKPPKEEVASMADQPMRVVRAVTAGSCGQEGCDIARNRCNVDVDTCVVTFGAAFNDNAVVFLGHLGKAPSGSCKPGAVIVGVEGQEGVSMLMGNAARRTANEPAQGHGPAHFVR
ncbi:MAG: hypothetical protein ABIG71_00040 [Candidatus Uhrbacteria bacterium]